ncbi:hypothetical protein [Streptomyces sp. NPDC023838]|uniref:hypothetical protein n=1 Tax=Streptomyces sp. NPDC023838 TaxID=3154325 RepID=UPI003402FA11
MKLTKGIGRVLKSKVGSVAAVGTMTTVAMVAGTGAAQAYYNQTWDLLYNSTHGTCIASRNAGSYALETGCFTSGGWVKVASGQPDTGYSNVQIKFSSGRCLQAVSAWTAEAKSCDSNNPSQIWAMTGSESNGWQFFTFGQRSCLDSGQLGLLFHQEGCNPNNGYQTWNR